jgi:L,D-peptidoglycan transpeptidase YkuD (ErfK/YbiS/YcfS/YnhG family)
MIIVKKSGYLKYKNLKFRCALGKAGVKKKEKEGDNITPKGIFKIMRMYYRPDKIQNIKTAIKKIKIKKNMAWCDDPSSPLYNQQIVLPNKFSNEKLYRKDSLYDLVLVLNYNTNPIIKNRGSAIFVHVAKNSYKKTRGCIALKKKHLIELISRVKKITKIKIN